MIHEPAATQPPSAIGIALEGGFYAGRLRVAGQVFALIVAPKALGDLDRSAWHSERTEVPDATSYCNGLLNTQAMAAAGSALAKQVLALEIGGFSDWYLPSRDELELLYRNLKPTSEENWVSFRDGDNPSSVPVGYPYTKAEPAQTAAEAFREGGAEAFDTAWYWASTQHSAGTAWFQDFADGTQGAGGKDCKGRARAVRRFLIA